MIAGKPISASPLKGIYLVQNRAANYLLRCLDRLLALFFSPRAEPLASFPGKLLISNLAHMGDVVQMTALLAALKKVHPDLKIGVVVGSWSLPIVKDHPCIDSLFLVDHWKLNRSSLPRWKKIVHYYATKKKALAQIRREGFEAALDTYLFFPNAIPLFWQARIPVRIGYSSGGFGPLLTHPVAWKASGKHQIFSYLPLLEQLNGSSEVYSALLRPCLPPLKTDSAQTLTKYGLEAKKYWVVHMGTGNPIKEWPLSKWEALVKGMEGQKVVFTGRGEREKRNADRVTSPSVAGVNLVDSLEWEEFLQVIKHAQCLIGCDSLAGHLAACFQTPSYLIYSGMTPLEEWAPFGNSSTLLTHPVPCSPCYRATGCKGMDCVRELSVETVLSRLRDINPLPPSPIS